MEKNFTSIQKQILFGILLGDAHLETQNNGKSFRLKIEQSLHHSAYVNHLYCIFQNFVLTPPKKRIVSHASGNQTINVRFSTVSSLKFCFFGKLFYKNLCAKRIAASRKKKIVPKNIHVWLSPRTLAYWFMDDGSMKSYMNKSVICNTQGFVYTEVCLLCTALQKHFHLHCWPRKQPKNTYQIYISGKSYEILKHIIYDYLIPEMRYKFPLPRKKKLK